MKSALGPSLIGLGLLFTCLPAVAADVGQLAPDFELVTQEGVEFRLSDYCGHKPVFVTFWNTWCSYCIKKTARYRNLQGQLGDKIEIIAINTTWSDSPEDMRSFYVTQKGCEIIKSMGADNVSWSVSGNPAVNLIAGGCRFGTDPRQTVLNSDCRAHDVENLYVTDGSFMPTGGSVPYTWTIYANAFRVADKILHEMGGAGETGNQL